QNGEKLISSKLSWVETSLRISNESLKWFGWKPSGRPPAEQTDYNIAPEGAIKIYQWTPTSWITREEISRDKHGHGQGHQKRKENISFVMRRERVFLQKWEEDFNWLYCNADGSKMCRVWVQTGRQNTFTRGCRDFQKSSLTRHGDQPSHRAAYATMNKG
ncbi:unnamed protein product, partial [Owenia fusiformis]